MIEPVADNKPFLQPLLPKSGWRVFLCMPCYGDKVDPDSHQRFLAGHSRPGGHTWGRCDIATLSRSLLANCFNILWCRAKNMREAGQGTKYFAMLHGDIVPEEGWLDILYEDLESSGADLMSAVVPLKDLRGITSTAIDDPKDPWNVERRISMHELMNKQLPDVFGSEHLGYPERLLLANSGCWIARLDRPWVDKLDEGLDPAIREKASDLLNWCDASEHEFLAHRIRSVVNELIRLSDQNIGHLKAHFNIRDSIKKDARGMWEPCVASEDWEFSRKIGAMGAKVMCTKRVKLNHMGGMPYGNSCSWGDQRTDMIFGKKFDFTPLFETKPVTGPTTANYQPSTVLPDVEGWLTDSEGTALNRLARGKRVLEVGSFKGRSTIWIARSADVVWCVDTFMSNDTASVENVDVEGEFRANLRRHSVDNVAVIRGRLADVIRDIPDDYFDFIFIDGAHDYLSVVHDLGVTLPKLVKNGVIAFHDYGAEMGVTKVVDEIIANKLAVALGTLDTLAVVRPITDSDSVTSVTRIEPVAEEKTNGRFESDTAHTNSPEQVEAAGRPTPESVRAGRVGGGR